MLYTIEIFNNKEIEPVYKNSRLNKKDLIKFLQFDVEQFKNLQYVIYSSNSKKVMYEGVVDELLYLYIKEELWQIK